MWNTLNSHNYIFMCSVTVYEVYFPKCNILMVITLLHSWHGIGSRIAVLLRGLGQTGKNNKQILSNSFLCRASLLGNITVLSDRNQV
jgi:hypothetical protein